MTPDQQVLVERRSLLAEKLRILDSSEQWRAMRVLRNLGAHEYDPNDAGRTRFVHALAADAPELMAIAARVVGYARQSVL